MEKEKKLKMMELIKEIEESLLQKFVISPIILPCDHICCRNCIPNLHKRCSSCSRNFSLSNSNFANNFLENICNSLMVVHEIYEQSSKFPQTQEGQVDSGTLSLDILSHSTLHYKQNYDAPLSNMNRKEIEAPIFARTTSSEIICSASVPLSPIYNHVKINDSEATNLYYSSGFISTENKEVHATHCEAPQLLSETSNTQLSEENRLSLKDEARFENSVQSISENFITSPSKDFVPDTYAVAEASPLQQGSQLSQQLTLSQDRNSLPYSKPSVILVPDTFHDDQMTLDIDISDNELEESDSSSCVSEEIHHISKVDNVGVSTGLHATDFRDQETATLVPRTQAVFSIESDDNPRIVLDTLDDFPSHTHPEARTNDSNLYELSSSEDDHENYLQFSSKRKKRDLQEIPPIPEHDVVNLVNDTLSSVPLSGLDGTLVSGTIQKSATLISSIENLPSELIENGLEVDNIPPKLQNTLEPEDNIPEVSFSLNRKSPPLSASVGKSDDQQIKSMPSIRRELDEGNEYNVESYCTQFDNERPEIGGYLYGAAIDSAVRRFTPQKPSPENKVQDQRSPEIAKNDTFHLNSKLPRTHDFNSESYETQDSLPSRFTWSKVVSTPLKQKNYARDATCEKPSPNEAQRPPPHPEESNTNDDIASWGESLFDRIHDIKKMINYQSGIVSPPSERIKKLPVQVSSPILPKSSHTTSPYVTLKRFTSATSEALEESQDIDGNNNQREEWITKAQTNISSPLLSSENYSDELTVSPYKRRHNMQEITGNILTKSETISSDESEPKFVEPIVPSNNPSCNSGISLPIIVKISSLSPQTIQLLQKCVERGYMILQCKDDFVPYTSNNSDILITLVESQKTRQGLSLCKRTLTYLKSLCIGSHWIVDAPNWLNDCLIEGKPIRPDKYEIGGSIHDTHVRGPSRSRLCIRDALGRSSLLKGYVFYLIPSGYSEPSPSTLTEEDVRWMIYFCGGTVLNQRWCDKCLNTNECQQARSENRLIVLDLSNPKSKKRKLEEESPALISLSPTVEFCGNCGVEFRSENCFLRQKGLLGVVHSPLLWLINVICAHKLLRTND